MPHRLGVEGCALQLQLAVGGLPGTSVQLHAVPGLLSGRVPSIIRSIEPELSTRSSTLGSGGLVSVCCARAPRGAQTAPTNVMVNVTTATAYLFIWLAAPTSR